MSWAKFQRSELQGIESIIRAQKLSNTKEVDVIEG